MTRTDSGPDDTIAPVKSIRAPIGITYEWSAGPSNATWIAGLLEGRLIARRCPVCRQVQVPPRGACPTCAVLLTDDVEVAHTGTITSFCVVNVPFLGQKIKIPYVAANILLDGADLPFQHLILGVDSTEVRMGMRVKAVWKPRGEWGPTLENIDHFEPSGEPDADFSTYARYL